MPFAPITDNPFTALSLIAAPAVLTNASSVLALGTSNRFARAIDRARSLTAQLENQKPDTDSTWNSLRVRQLDRIQRRIVLLVNALTAFYLALGSFGSASLVSLLGAVFAETQNHVLFKITSILALLVGVVGVCSLVAGCSMLVRETRFAVANLTEEATLISTKYDGYMKESDR